MNLAEGNDGNGDSFMHEFGHLLGLEHRWIYVDGEYGRVPETQDNYKGEGHTVDAMGKPGGPNFIQGDQSRGLIGAAQSQQSENGGNTQVIDANSRVPNYDLSNQKAQQVND